MAANLFTLRLRMDGSFTAKPGILTGIQKILDADGNDLGVVSGLVLGPRFGHLAKRAIIIPVDHSKRPERDSDGVYAYRGSFVEDKDGTNPRLQEFDPAEDAEGTIYLRIQTGFDPNLRGGASAQLDRMIASLGLKPGQPFKAERHGAAVIEAGPETHQMRGLGHDETAEDAKVIWQFIGKVGAFGVPPYTDTLVRMGPQNSATIGGNIDGRLALCENKSGVLKTNPAGAQFRPLLEAGLPRKAA